jgi:hypothetical protein
MNQRQCDSGRPLPIGDDWTFWKHIAFAQQAVQPDRARKRALRVNGGVGLKKMQGFITSFRAVPKHPDYDWGANPRMLALCESFPIAMEWSCGSQGRTWSAKEGGWLHAILTADRSGIAVVEISASGRSEAFLVNCDGTLRFTLQLPAECKADSSASFRSFYYHGSQLNVVVELTGGWDALFSVDEQRGQLVHSRTVKS